MRRVHNTKHIQRLRDKKRIYPLHQLDLKPHGIWYSIDAQWLDWCINHDPSRVGKFNYTLEINTRSILVLKNYNDVVVFMRKYRIDPFGIIMDALIFIDWQRVKQDYKGIEIRNYKQIQGDAIFRMKAMFGPWFYSWDVCSGCIWDPSAIRSYRRSLTPKKWLVRSASHPE